MTQAKALFQAHAVFVQHRLELLLLQADRFLHHPLVGAEDLPPLPHAKHIPSANGVPPFAPHFS